MTLEQHARLAWFMDHGYRPRILRQVMPGIWIILLPCKLSGNRMPLRLQPDGSYIAQRYHLYRYRKEYTQPWLS